MKKILTLLFAFGVVLISAANVGTTPLDNFEVVDDVGIVTYDQEDLSFDVLPDMEFSDALMQERQKIPVAYGNFYSARYAKRNPSKLNLTGHSPPYSKYSIALLKRINFS